jgi:hypothetical protein
MVIVQVVLARFLTALGQTINIVAMIIININVQEIGCKEGM